jgi:hypothetical protein
VSYILGRPWLQKCGKKARRSFSVRFFKLDSLAHPKFKFSTATKVKERDAVVLASAAATLVDDAPKAKM